MGTEDRDQFDELLDGALKRYGNVEPRTALETRILANLAAAQNSATGRCRWILGLAIAACACAVLVIATFSVRNASNRVGGAGAKQTVAVAEPVSPVTAAAKTEPSTRNSPPRQRKLESRANEVLPAASARLSQFPSPRPLSKQEQMLKAYVDEFPKEAALVAKEQAEREKETEAFLSDETTGSRLNQER